MPDLKLSKLPDQTPVKITIAVADEHYAELTQTEKPGKTVADQGDETRRFGETCQQMAADLKTALLPPGDLAPPRGEVQ